MKNKTKWTIGFLGVTGLAIAMELYAALFYSQDRPPWTTLIIDHIPFEVFCLIWGGLAVWITIHFLKWYGIIKEKK